MSCGLSRQNTPLRKVTGCWSVLEKKNQYPSSPKYSLLRTSCFIYHEEYLVGCENSGIWPFSSNAFSDEDFKGASLYVVGVMYPLL